MEEQTQSRKVIGKIINLKYAVREGDFEKKREAELELREAFKEIGLEERLINYLVAHIKRATAIEKAYEEQCEFLSEVRETIRELARKL
jgi:alcohol dehydrogenase YqhD (iron-dependent ADH family)